jgi:prepilin-type N-terminal cleavage/methylation domain-containing protein
MIIAMNELPNSRGFTLIELLVAMAVFSMLLVIIVMGFMNVVRIRNQALAANATQDSARTAMNEVVRTVRDSLAVLPSAANTLCLQVAGGGTKYFYIDATNKDLRRADVCTPTPPTSSPITDPEVRVAVFTAVPQSTGVTKSPLKITLKVASDNGTSDAAGNCNANNADREFCSSVTLVSSAVPR